MFSSTIHKNIGPQLLVHHDRDNNLKLLLSQSQPVQPLVISSFSNLLPISLQWDLFTLWFIYIQVKNGLDCQKNLTVQCVPFSSDKLKKSLLIRFLVFMVSILSYFHITDFYLLVRICIKKGFFYDFVFTYSPLFVK